MKNEEEKEKYLEKIQKLLHLAKRSTNEHEAANAISQAQNLMHKFGLSELDIDLKSIKEFQSEHCPSDANKLPEYVVSLANMLCYAFGVNCYYTWTRNHRRSVSFYGPTERPQIAAYGFDVLSIQLIKARSEFIASQNKRIKRTTKTNRADQFCAGWVSGARNAISRFTVEPEEQQLMSLYYKQISEGFSELKSREAKSCRGDDDAYHAGYHSGKDARLHQAVAGKSVIGIER
ncbi:DUF2786 domain-containing protein [Pectobacterium brasiliense]|uniref:DUF2786 domain-containing protein n=2 Tax=Pectobacterium TaxID=122277 RepID=A0ABS0S2F0_PECPM|nr:MULTISPECIES: DUF2786 domain-containing protein [Pectobacterium]GKW32103.1 hypothetical protein PEC730217_08830 [Pectobacterium carotovorum subsp. carotovorum]ACX86522.1 conserved hypothetical protein [Pectobacterium parmentieri WPP163]MBI0555938.1 DUF2786 domain-containing protein [Pectobacterium parmentieri]MBS4430930.1 DUF2786 domain-containing protein [Pectobacterium punjabense]MBT9184299.1 DUF2786 domain-containing protein [Pectobacterium punjabense]